MSNHPVFLVMLVAVAATLIAEIPIGFRLPVVVLEMVLGIVIGPHGLGMTDASGLLGWLGGTAGLAALFFMGGVELDLDRVRGRPLALAVGGWALSLLLGLSFAGLLYLASIIRSPVLVGLSLTTTSLGMLLPILKDKGEFDTQFGRFALAAGAVGEFGPVIVMSLLLTTEYSHWQEVVLMLAFVGIAFVAANVALKARPPKALELLTRTMNSSAQLPVLLSVLLLTSFLVLSETFGFEGVLGAFAGGMVVGLATRGKQGEPLREKIDAIGFGFFMPFFFVVSGIKFDLGALLNSRMAMLILPMFLVLLFVVRGAPVYLYRKELAKAEKLPFALYSASALPLIVALTEIGVRTHRMTSDIAAALVGAGMVSVLLFPTLAGILRTRSVSPADHQ
ncbi:MAG: cation:proton antiporter [Deltaproteobacteria bacterium]|nr:cation:proton antiporter [Deltaproteobacteria bacterium]